MAQVNQVDTVALAIATAQTNMSLQTAPAGFSNAIPANLPAQNNMNKIEQQNGLALKNEIPTQ